jgi:hypothetical protein
MVEPAPKIDKRTAEDVAKQVQLLLAEYLPGEFRNPPNTGNPRELQGISAALVKIFARFSEIIIERLNQVPDKNFLAFLDLLGASRLPPQPARVPLTFSLASGSAVDAVVPAGTQVAAPPAEGQKEPVIFETERELVVTAAELVSIFTRDPQQDRYGDKSVITQPTSSLDVPVFQGENQIAHILYIAHDTLLGYPDLQNLTLKFQLEQVIQNPDARSLQWEIWDGEKEIPILPPSAFSRDLTKPRITRDTTSNLTRNGDEDGLSGSLVFANLPQVSQQTIFGITSRWLRCRLQTPITKATEKQDNRVRDRPLGGGEANRQLPSISNVTLQATIGQSGQAIAWAFTNQLPVDLSKPFYPFGEKPKFGDTLYLANEKAFSKSGATVTLHVNLANLSDLGLALPDATKEPKPTLQWEIWGKQGWKLLGTSNQDGKQTGNFLIKDNTQAFTVAGTNDVELTLPEQLETTTINGIESFWIRVMLVSGDYGKEASYVKDDRQASGYRFNSPTFKPPLIHSIKVSYTLTLSDKKPDEILTYNDFNYQKIVPGSTFKPFEAIADNRPTLYLGFSLPATRNTFPNRTLTLLFRLADVIYNPNLKQEQSSSTSPPRLVWQYWSGSGKTWEKLTVRDETEAFTRPGLVEFLPPKDFAAKSDFGLDKERYWLRVQWESGDYPVAPPKLRRVLLNTTMAAQTVTIRNETLGSSDGSEGQRFRTTQAPVLPGQQLQVRELELPAANEQNTLKKEEGEDAIATILDTTGRPQEIWVRWHEVPDFYGSNSRDRHYVLDHLTGEIQFGNGLNGLIPPVGTGNVRMAYYRTGGGTAGNKSAGTIVQLKTTVPYIDKVTNTEAAAGGADAEGFESLRDREPRKLRHNNRAVTLEDYEDLAILASPEVVRAKSVSLLNLLKNPLDVQNLQKSTPNAPGAVSIIIVPRATDATPVPSMELIDRVRDYLLAHSLPTVNVSVVGPLYISVNVKTEIVLTSLEGASSVVQTIEQKLASFLHPLTGGFNGTGWAFGRIPHKSDFYALLEAISGVDYIRTLNLSESIPPVTLGEKDDNHQPDSDELQKMVVAIKDTGRFLVCSGKHAIDLF